MSDLSSVEETELQDEAIENPGWDPRLNREWEDELNARAHEEHLAHLTGLQYVEAPCAACNTLLWVSAESTSDHFCRRCTELDEFI